MAALLSEMWEPLAMTPTLMAPTEEKGSEASSSGEEEKGRRRERRIGYYEGAADDDDGCFPWSGTVVWTWQDLRRRISGGVRLLAPGTSSAAAGRGGSPPPHLRRCEAARAGDILCRSGPWRCRWSSAGAATTPTPTPTSTPPTAVVTSPK
uniref:Uncharacterized protein n=1 Tax=Oryza meridionalis TaxID=40149 RepID=A0A0E0DNM4_9ORYZ